MRCFSLILCSALIFAAVNGQEAKKEEDASKERTFGPLLNMIGSALNPHNQYYPGNNYYPGHHGGYYPGNNYYPGQHHGGHHGGYYPGNNYYPGQHHGGYYPHHGGHYSHHMGYPNMGYPGYGMFRSGDEPTKVEEKNAENKA